MSATAAAAENDGDFEVIVKNIQGHKRPYTVKPTDTLRKLKDAICATEGVQPELFRLVVKGRQLKDAKTIKDLKIKPNMKISMVLKLRGGMMQSAGDENDGDFEVIVKNILGHKHPYKVKPKDTLRKLKDAICASEGMQSEQIRLVVKGRQLKDAKTIKDLKIKPNLKISMVLSLRGGMMQSAGDEKDDDFKVGSADRNRVRVKLASATEKARDCGVALLDRQFQLEQAEEATVNLDKAAMELEREGKRVLWKQRWRVFKQYAARAAAVAAVVAVVVIVVLVVAL